MSMGVNIFGDRARKAIMKELEQVVSELRYVHPLRKILRCCIYALLHITVITEKLVGSVKARYVVGKVASCSGTQVINWGIYIYIL